MPLYQQARNILESRGRLQEHDSWCHECRAHAAPAPGDGGQIAANVAAEEHFCGGSAAPDPASYAVFLDAARCDPDARSGYEEACKGHNLEGTLVPTAAVPAQAFAYTSGPGLRRAISLTAGGRLPSDDEELADELAAAWGTVYRPIFDRSVHRARGRAVFVAIPADGRAPHAIAGGSARATWALLGLAEAPEARFELVFEISGLGPLRVPTVADAAWYSYFRPACEGAPTGMTWHREEDRAGVPEAVTPEISLACVPSSPRYLHD
jgi:hypothetical protein